jgi:uroporphyrinogen-III synthase
MKTLLITRNLGENSPIKALNSDKIKVIGESFIAFEQIDFEEWNDEADMVIFYSQRGVEYGLSNEEFMTFCIGKTLVTFGSATASFLTEEYGLIADIVGNGDSEDLMKEVIDANPENVLFVQGDKSLRRLQTDEKWTLPFSELITYRSNDRIVDMSDAPEIVVFTSPLNVLHYCSQYQLKDNQTVWAIGTTTAGSLKQYYSGQIFIPPTPTEASLATEIRRSISTNM